MKFIESILLILILISSSCCKKDISEIVPEYKFIKTFSEKIKSETGLILYSYGINAYRPKNYQFKNGVHSFGVSYALFKTRQDVISLDESRSLLISVAESFLQAINSNQEIRSHLDSYPFNSDLIRITIYFKDENSIDLGQGISTIYFSKGKIEYERYEIHEYTGHYPAIGEHFTVHEETYAEALDIVKKQGSLMQLL